MRNAAVLSVLAFIGSLATKDLITVSQISRVAGSLLIFAIGVAAAVVGMGFSYLTHFFEANYFGSLKLTDGSPDVNLGQQQTEITGSVTQRTCSP